MTSHQVPRGARPDAEKFNRMYLVKNVSHLRPTYQIRLLAFHAVDSGKKLVLKVPSNCRFHPDLEGLVNTHRKHIEREDL